MKHTEHTKQVRLGKNQQLFFEAWDFGIRDIDAIMAYTGLNKQQATSCMGSLWARGLLIDNNNIEVSFEEILVEGVKVEMEHLDEWGVDLDGIIGKEIEYDETENSKEAIIYAYYYSCLSSILTVGYEAAAKRMDIELDMRDGGMDRYRDKVLGSKYRHIVEAFYNKMRGMVEEQFQYYDGGFTKEDYERQRQAERDAWNAQANRQREEMEAQQREQQRQWEEAYRNFMNGFGFGATNKDAERKAFAKKVGYELTGDDKMDYKRMSMLCHPDRGGSNELMVALNALYR